MPDHAILHVVESAEGDCLILDADIAGASGTVLIDGGPAGIYRRRLAPVLDDLHARGRHLDRVMLSHVDADHVSGLIDLFAAFRDGDDASRPVAIRTAGLWHNQFSRTVDADGELQPRLAAVLQSLQVAGLASPESEFTLDGVAQGDKLLRLATQIGCPVNADYAGAPIVVGAGDVTVGPMRFRLVGPTRANLDALRAEWASWLERQEEAIGRGEPQLAAFSDKSIPNLSSLQYLVEVAGKTVLLTGDGRGDHLLSGLAEVGLLDGAGRLHVDVFKLPHHGSDRNTTRQLFEQITADTYVVSANGKHGNPDLPTLLWLVDAAGGRRFALVATNRTETLDELVAVRPPGTFSYTLTIRDPSNDSVAVDLLRPR